VSGIAELLRAFDSAMGTPCRADDLALLKSMFSRNDTFLLSDFHDKMRGFGGNDLMRGDSGNDTLHGDGGADTLTGDKGNDRLFGNAGRDLLDGGKGKDFLVGGGGSDVFVFATGDGKDRIKDFVAKGKYKDVLDLSDLNSLTNWADLRDNHLTQKNGNVVIDGLGGDKITLLGVKIGDLDAGDFLF
jgi:Ca2+-binding RTX toxin-like protein